MKMSVGRERVGEPAGYAAPGRWVFALSSCVLFTKFLPIFSLFLLPCPLSSVLFLISPLSLSLSSSPSFLSLDSLLFFCFFVPLHSPSLISFQFSFVRYARSVHLLYDGRTCILRGPPQKEVALKGKARLIR